MPAIPEQVEPGFQPVIVIHPPAQVEEVNVDFEFDEIIVSGAKLVCRNGRENGLHIVTGDRDALFGRLKGSLVGERDVLHPKSESEILRRASVCGNKVQPIGWRIRCF